MDAETFIARWDGAGGTERQNSQSFLNDLCDLLSVPRPEPGQGDYAFEREVKHVERGTTNSRFMDLYRRGAFILESKQSHERMHKADPGQGALMDLPETEAPIGTPAWQRLMSRAFNQAKGYVSDLPEDHPAPPFLILVDVGRVIELYSDFSGQGRNYTQFTDRGTYQIRVADLAREETRDLLHTVWTDPASLNPALRSAEVTKDIAERLARVARALERKHAPEEVAGFLMRCVFTMFAEDTGLLPTDGFRDLLAGLRDRPEGFVTKLETLWHDMDKGSDFSMALDEKVRRFNGGLFKETRALALDAEGINELTVAAGKDWRDVEPAIFGTLLERALSPRERASLGAHYTPRAYVERLVVATVIDPLREDWENTQAAVDEATGAGNTDTALKLAQDFHHALCTTRVLDPACGTGNFLYVALELMKRLEGEVLEAIEALGGAEQSRLLIASETVEPSQFLGLELNTRAAAIADVVLWVGYLKWQLRTGGLKAIPEPVLKAHGNIREQDALLSYDAKEPVLDEDGAPVTVWDGHTTTAHPVTGLPVPDASARVPSYAYTKPRRADWPEAEFIVGNPPFVGGKDLRDEMGSGYAEALWAARPEVPGGADIVMHWWDEAARRLSRPGSPLRRFGFITTNSATQTFSRRVIERHLNPAPKESKGRRAVSLAFAVADHPWVKGAGRAAVRIAMTVMRRGAREGVLGTVTEERDLNTDAPIVKLEKITGRITSRLSIGVDIESFKPLLSNAGLIFQGYKPHGKGFIVKDSSVVALATIERGGAQYVAPYINGSDIVQRNRNVRGLNFFPLSEDELRNAYPEAYQHLLDTVKPERDHKKRDSYRQNWWIFAEPRQGMRKALAELKAYIATTETAKHRIFVFRDTKVAPDQKIRVITVNNSALLSILSSRVHVHYCLNTGGTLEDRPVYVNALCFDPYPFPALLTDPAPDAAGRALLERLRDLGARLEALREDRLAADRALTLTGLYNRLERRREAVAKVAEPLSEDEREDHARHHVPYLSEIHDDIDRAVLGAYGWGDLAGALVGRPGATLPSPHKAPEQEAAEDALLHRLVALNRERREEEARGRVRWLRPDYQARRLGAKVSGGAQDEMDTAIVTPAEQRPWPDAPRVQFSAVREVLGDVDAPLPAEGVARSFKGKLTAKRRARVEEVLAVLGDLGHVLKDSETGGFIARR